MKISGAIFDLDGTLLDSMFIWETIGEDYIKAKGFVPEDNLRDKLKNTSLKQAAEYLKYNYPLTESIDKIVDEVNVMTEDFYINKGQLKDGAKELLYFFKNKGVKMCVATATDRYLAEAALKRNDILHYFDRIFTCSEVGHGKDEPHIFRQALEFLGTDKTETWVFEDACHAAKTAKKDGFRVCGIYDKWERNSSAVKDASDLYIKSFTEAIQLTK